MFCNQTRFWEDPSLWYDIDFVTDTERVTDAANEAQEGLIQILVADCGSNNKDAEPEISCDCCSICCDDLTGCKEEDIGNQTCEAEAESYNSLAAGVEICECREAGNETGGIIHSVLSGSAFPSDKDEDIRDGNTGGTVVSCHNTFMCNICGKDDDQDCVSQWDGYTFDEQGIRNSYFERYAYVPGSLYEGRVVALVFDVEGCHVSVDGIICNHCLEITCPDRYNTIQVACDNIPDTPSFDGCHDTSQSTSSVLQVFQESYKYDARHFAPTCKHPNHKSFCNLASEQTETYCDGVDCYCDESGLIGTCVQKDCKFCLEIDSYLPSSNNANDVDDEQNQVCFSILEKSIYEEGNIIYYERAELHFYILDNEVIPTSSPQLIIFSHQLTDGSCAVSIDGETCTSCITTTTTSPQTASGNITTATTGDDPSVFFDNSTANSSSATHHVFPTTLATNLVVNCENILGKGAVYYYNNNSSTSPCNTTMTTAADQVVFPEDTSTTHGGGPPCDDVVVVDDDDTTGKDKGRILLQVLSIIEPENILLSFYNLLPQCIPDNITTIAIP